MKSRISSLRQASTYTQRCLRKWLFSSSSPPTRLSSRHYSTSGHLLTIANKSWTVSTRKPSILPSSSLSSSLLLLSSSSYHSTTFLPAEDAAPAAVAVAATEAPPAEDSGSQEEEEEKKSTEGEEEEEPHPTSIDYAFTPAPPLSDESQKKVDDLFEKILWLDMIEVHLLTSVVNEQLGIAWDQVDFSGGPGTVAGGAAAGAAGGGAEEEQAEEKLLKDIKLVGFDAKAKIKVIKEVRAIAGLGLKEAKELVEAAPKVIQKDLKPDKAEELKAQLEAVGAQIEIS